MSATRVPFGEARAHLRDLVCRAAYGGERITITRNGSPAAALVSLDDLRALEALAEAAAETGAGADERRAEAVDETVVIAASRGVVWFAVAHYRYRVPWWSDFMLGAYLDGEVIVSWDERTGRVVECVDGETITMVWGDRPGPAGSAVEVRFDLSAAAADPADPADAEAAGDSAGIVVRIRQAGPGPGAEYWRDRLAAWRDYAEAGLSG